MSTSESIAWLQQAIDYERALASASSLAGWPSEANHYRRQARKAMRILERVRASEK